ncbi:hypothetical protein IAI10_06180 [Clostridium sp. 19966]|uniref:DUF960 family protein n=1 Tax=Clostridium sp. 19966 TaxID=2768166 RepID=UPI0028DFC7F2|nr:DUF960 family protein [Clostridium sp. 19966]MDT8716238.1 hypothetical protein [Clostridium sp. 19966]
MFKGIKYVTKGITEAVPEFLQNFLWYTIEIMEVKEKDYLQVFELSEITQDGVKKQKIIHFQEKQL